MRANLRNAILAVVFISVLSVAFYQAGYQQASINGVFRLAEQSEARGSLTVVMSFKNGTVVTYTNHNLVVNNAKKYMRNILGFNNITNQNATIYMSVSNDATPLATWTKLPGEMTDSGFVKAAGTPIVINGTAYNCTFEWTSTADSVQLQCGGIGYNPTSTSDGDLYAAALFPQTTFDINDKLKLIWELNHP